MGRLAGWWQPRWVVPGAGVVVLAIALAGDSLSPSVPLAVAVALLVAFLPLGAAIGAVLVLAASPALFYGATVGPLSVVDLLVVTLTLRNLATSRFWQRSWRSMFFWLGVVTLLAGGIATLAAPGSPTPFMRVGAYLALGLTTSRVIERCDLRLALAAFLGASLGQACAGILTITAAAPSNLPIGRYLGTLGDPGQFGIPIAAALLLLFFSTSLIESALLRYAGLLVLLTALVGSNTRGAWGAAVVAFIVAISARVGGDELSPRTRFAVGFGLGLLLVVLVAAVTIGAPLVGLNPGSTRIRIDTVAAGWDYLQDHPLDPRGLGNSPAELPIYGTWLALAVALTPVTAIALLGYALRGTAQAQTSSVDGVFPLLVVFLACTISETLVYGGSFPLLVWLVLLGAAAAPAVSTADRYSRSATTRKLLTNVAGRRA